MEVFFIMEINSYDLVQLIICLLSDEENREVMETELYNEISQLKGESAIRSALLQLCKKITE